MTNKMGVAMKWLYTRYPIVARALGRVRRASKGILHTNEMGVVIFTKMETSQIVFLRP